MSKPSDMVSPRPPGRRWRVIGALLGLSLSAMLFQIAAYQFEHEFHYRSFICGALLVLYAQIVARMLEVLTNPVRDETLRNPGSVADGD